ncbi:MULTISPECIES: peptide deformylase [Streptomyces]|uniref:peptide deformylase n=1 Tax=Streptomyces TaxID=1883 RepID=UPI00167BFE7B|nr:MULTISPECIES: peptide deformylase [Streptomyces]MBD3580855.1 peptide deformylase [Streptomyces sp. KD18]GGT20625.1 peptide deformylase 3 [Streptomyces toxytricini]
MPDPTDPTDPAVPTDLTDPTVPTGPNTPPPSPPAAPREAAAERPLPPEALRGAFRPITEVGADILHRRCADVTGFGTPELSRLVDDMFFTMHAARGVGLAANQIGVNLRVFVYDCPDDDGVRHIGHVCNPVLDPLPDTAGGGTDPAAPAVVRAEGCLSVPGARHELARAGRAVVRGSDKDGNPVVVEGTGFFARCLQHETDHLDGTLYTDRLTPDQRARCLADMAENAETVRAARLTRAQLLGR